MNPSRAAAAWSAASRSQAARVASSMPHASSDQSTPSAERAVRSAASSASGAAPRRRLASANAVSSVRTSGAAATSRSHARRAGTRRATSSSRCAASGDRARVTTERSSTSSRDRGERNAAESQGQQRAGGGDDRGGVDAVVAIEIGARLERLGHQHAGGEEVHGAVGGIPAAVTRVAQPIAATQNGVAILGSRRGRQRLAHGARRQSQVEALALASGDGGEAVEQDPLHL